MGHPLCSSLSHLFSVGDFPYFTFYHRPIEFENQGLMLLRHRLLAVCAYGPVLREAIQEPMRRTGKMLGEEDRERERGRVEGGVEKNNLLYDKRC